VRRRPRQPLDVGGQGRVVLPVIGRMVADDVDHPRRRLVGVVDVGEPVGQPRPQMQQGRRRPVAHPVVPVGRPGHHPLEQPQDAAHPLDPIERRHKVHLRRARIGEAHIDATPDQRPYQTLRTVHHIHSARRNPGPPHPAGRATEGQVE
jgi:hypothetical protein